MVLNLLTTLASHALQPKKRPLIEMALSLGGMTGLEIGGSTKAFGLKGIFPIYPFAGQIDNVSYARNTVWGDTEDRYNYFKGKSGKQIITEATDLSLIPDNSYNFVLSSHSLEHIANPLKALMEWRRVAGTLILFVPNKDNTFDVNRPFTSLYHLISDYNNDTKEDDTTHLKENIKAYDPTKHNVTFSEYKKLIENNFETRCAHHHVFHQYSIKWLLSLAGFNNIKQTQIHSHLITIAQCTTQ